MESLQLVTNRPLITKARRLPRFKRARKPPNMVLMPRDKRILRAVHAYRMLTREQIERLLFQPEHGQDHCTKTSKARLRLKLLYHHQYLERVPMPVGNGTWAWQPVYRLAAKGAQCLAADLGMKAKDLQYWGKGVDRNKRATEVTPLFLSHALKVNDVHVALALASQQNGFQVEKWVDDGQLKSQEWKDYVAVVERGRQRIVGVIPDAYFVLHLGDRRAHFLLELDRATMTNTRWSTRIRAYLSYVRSGKYTERYGTRSLRILTVTTTEQRLRNLQNTTRKAGGGDLFWFTTLDQVSPSSVFFRPIWLLANDEPERARKALLG